MKKDEKKVWRISYSGSGICMVGPTGDTVGPGKDLKPRDLANIAWDKGADEVVHDYDLSKLNSQGLYIPW